MVRVALIRIFKGLHPFSADRNHLHHILQSHFNKTQTTFIILSLIFVPLIFYFYIKNSLLVIFLGILIYSLLLFIFRKKIIIKFRFMWEVKKSRVHGNGIYATKKIKKGSKLFSTLVRR